MLCAYVVMAKRMGLLHRQLYHFLGFRSEWYITGYDGARAGLHKLLDLEPYLVGTQSEIGKYRCGDAFASTFVSALIMGHTPLEALQWAPVNPMSVAQFVGSQEGLLSRDQLEWWLSRAPADFKPKEI